MNNKLEAKKVRTYCNQNKNCKGKEGFAMIHSKNESNSTVGSFTLTAELSSLSDMILILMSVCPFVIIWNVLCSYLIKLIQHLEFTKFIIVRFDFVPRLDFQLTFASKFADWTIVSSN